MDTRGPIPEGGTGHPQDDGGTDGIIEGIDEIGSGDFQLPSDDTGSDTEVGTGIGGSGEQATSGETEAPKRGRPRASGESAKPRQIHSRLNRRIARIEHSLVAFTAMAATMARTPEMALSPQESHEVAECARDVAKFYISEKILDPKVEAWIDLAWTIGSIGAIHVIGYSIRQMRERAMRQHQAAPVYTRPNPAANGASRPGPVPQPGPPQQQRPWSPPFSIQPKHPDGED